MLLFIYMIYVVFPLSKMKNEGKRVSIFTKVIVYGLLILSLFMFYFRFLAFLFSPLPFFGFLAALAIGGTFGGSYSTDHYLRQELYFQA